MAEGYYQKAQLEEEREKKTLTRCLGNRVGASKQATRYVYTQPATHTKTQDRKRPSLHFASTILNVGLTDGRSEPDLCSVGIMGVQKGRRRSAHRIHG